MLTTSKEKKIKGIGSIPLDWEVTKLSGITEFITKGTTPTTYGFQWEEEGIPFFKSDCIKEGKFVYGDFQYISKEAHDALNRSKIQKGDILISITGDVGKVAIIPEAIDEGNINQHVARIRVKKGEISRDFIYHWLNQINVRNYYNVIKTGLAYPQISLEQVRNTEIPIPKKTEQQKIASILSTWDKAIELKEKLIEQKKEQKKGLMQKLLTGEVRLPGFAGRWQQVRLGNLTKLQGGYAFKSAEFVQQGIPIIRISNIDPEIIETNQDFVYYDEIGISDSFKVNFGDILIAMSGATTGKVGLYKKREIAYLNQRVGKFVNLDKSKLDYSFLYHLIMSSMFKLQLKEELATGAQPNISSRQIENFKFKIPSLDEQKKISKTLNQIDRSINLQEKEIVYLKQQKQGLMQLLLTGKVRVKV